MLTNIDPAGDAILHNSILPLLDGLREAVALNASSWRQYPSNRFGSLYVRVTKRYIMPKGCRRPREVNTVELASIDIREVYRGRGAFRVILRELKLIAKSSGRVLYLENVLNPFLLQKLQADPDFKALKQFDCASAPCFAHFPK